MCILEFVIFLPVGMNFANEDSASNSPPVTWVTLADSDWKIFRQAGGCGTNQKSVWRGWPIKEQGGLAANSPPPQGRPAHPAACPAHVISQRRPASRETSVCCRSHLGPHTAPPTTPTCNSPTSERFPITLPQCAIPNPPSHNDVETVRGKPSDRRERRDSATALLRTGSECYKRACETGRICFRRLPRPNRNRQSHPGAKR